MSESLYAWALSADGLTMARCHETCDVLRVRDGRVLVHGGGGAGQTGIDGTPAAEMPANAALFRKYLLSPTSAPWPLADVALDWSLAPRGAAVTYHLRDRASPSQLPIARFASRDRYVFPGRFVLSQNGLTLVLTAETRDVSQGLGYEDAVVDLPAAVALLYLEAAAATPTDTALDERAQRACSALR